MPHRTQKGFALMMVMGITILFMILGGTTAYMVFKAQQMSSGQARYTSALVAADAGQDVAGLMIADSVEAGANLTALTTVVPMGSYQDTIRLTLLGVAPLPSGSSEMASAYEGIGSGAGSRGAASYYRVVTKASKTTLIEMARVEVLRRKLIGGE